MNFRTLGVAAHFDNLDQGIFCSYGTTVKLLDSAILILGVLIYVYIHYRMTARILMQQAQDMGMEELVDVRHLYKYPLILIAVWFPSWLYEFLKAVGAGPVFGVYIFDIIGVNLQGAINGIYYLRQNHKSGALPKAKETMDYSLDEINLESNEKPLTEEESRKKLELALKF